MTTVVMFNGQGCEFAGMGQQLDHNSLIFKETLDQAQAVLPYDLRAYLFGAQPLVEQPAYLQPALVAYELALYRASGVQADAFIGLSLGEYAALCAAGMLSLEAVLQVTLIRGHAMAEAARQTPGLMLAVQLRATQHLPALPDGVWLANRNAPDQVVVGGVQKQLADYAAALKEAGIRHMPLAVAGAFHTPLMQAAQPALNQALQRVAWQAPVRPVFSTTTQQPFAPATVAETLTQQLTHTTALSDVVHQLAVGGATDFIEVSPKPMLAKLVKRQLPDVTTYTLDEQAL